MFHRVLVVALAGAALTAPALAATGPVGDADFQCFAAAAVAETKIRRQLDDSKIVPGQRSDLTKAADLMRTISNWYLARISTLPPESRTVAAFDRAQAQTKALDKDKMNSMFKRCIEDVNTDRGAALKRLLT